MHRPQLVKVQPTFRQTVLVMVLILADNIEIGAYVWSKIENLISSRHSFRSKNLFFKKGTAFVLTYATCYELYLLIFVVWIESESF